MPTEQETQAARERLTAYFAHRAPKKTTKDIEACLAFYADGGGFEAMMEDATSRYGPEDPSLPAPPRRRSSMKGKDGAARDGAREEAGTKEDPEERQQRRRSASKIRREEERRKQVTIADPGEFGPVLPSPGASPNASFGAASANNDSFAAASILVTKPSFVGAAALRSPGTPEAVSPPASDIVVPGARTPPAATPPSATPAGTPAVSPAALPAVPPPQPPTASAAAPGREALHRHPPEFEEVARARAPAHALPPDGPPRGRPEPPVPGSALAAAMAQQDARAEDRQRWQRRLMAYYAVRAPHKTERDCESCLAYYEAAGHGGFAVMWADTLERFGPEPTAGQMAAAEERAFWARRLLAYYTLVDGGKTEKDVGELLDRFTLDGRSYEELWVRVQDKYGLAVDAPKAAPKPQASSQPRASSMEPLPPEQALPQGTGPTAALYGRAVSSVPPDPQPLQEDAVARRCAVVMAIAGVSFRTYSAARPGAQQALHAALCEEVAAMAQLQAAVLDVVRVVDQVDGVAVEMAAALPDDASCAALGRELVRQVTNGECSVAGIRHAYRGLGGDPGRVFIADAAVCEVHGTHGLRYALQLGARAAEPLRSATVPDGPLPVYHGSAGFGRDVPPPARVQAIRHDGSTTMPALPAAAPAVIAQPWDVVPAQRPPATFTQLLVPQAAPHPQGAATGAGPRSFADLYGSPSAPPRAVGVAASSGAQDAFERRDRLLRGLPV